MAYIIKNTPNFILLLFSIILIELIELDSVEAKSIINLTDLPWNKTSIKEIQNFKILSHTNVTSHKKMQNGIKQENQTLEFKIAGLHKRNCQRAIPILFDYPNYKNNIEAVNESSYDIDKGRIYVSMNAPLLGTAFILNFKIPPITKPGVYSFTFDQGILLGLLGEIQVVEIKDHCLIFVQANWTGNSTPFPNLIFELFANTASKMTLNKLFRISGSTVQ